MPQDIYLDKLLLNRSLVSLWYPISFQSIFDTTFSFTLNLITVILKVVMIAVWLLRIPMLTTLQSLTRRKNGRDKIKLSSKYGYQVERKDRQVVQLS